jgi:hypothetical protein
MPNCILDNRDRKFLLRTSVSVIFVALYRTETYLDGEEIRFFKLLEVEGGCRKTQDEKDWIFGLKVGSVSSMTGCFAGYLDI